MSAATEYDETLRAEVLVRLRRLGSNRVHFALVMPETLTAATHWGAACTAVEAPVSAFCSRTLRGQLVVIPTEYHESQRKHFCRECQLVAALAMRSAEQ